jgi:hypothetical protein
MRDEFVPGGQKLLAKSLKPSIKLRELAYRRGVGAEIVVPEKKSNRMIVILAEVPRGVGNFANLQNHIFDRHPVEVAEEYWCRARHAGLILIGAGLEQDSAMPIN